MCFSGGQTPFSPFPAMQEGTSYFFFSLFIKIIQIIPVILFIINFIFYRYIILNIFSSLAGIQFVMKSLLVTCIEVIQFWIISVLYHCLSFCLLSLWFIFLVHNITKIIIMIRVVLMITNVILQVSRPFHSQHFQQKVRWDSFSFFF